MPFSSVLGASSVIKPGVCTSTTRPTVPYVGQLIYETDTNKVASWNGSTWVYNHSSGLVHLNTSTFASTTSVSVNNVFTSTSDYYRILFFTWNSTSGDITIRMRNNGTDDTTAANYDYTRTYRDFVSRPYGSSVIMQSGDSFPIVGATGGASTQTSLVLDLVNPGSAYPTDMFGFAATGIAWTTWGRHGTASAQDGFTLSCTQSMTGKVSVYAYRT